MPLWVHCSQCDQHYQFPDAAAGKQAACPKCGQRPERQRPRPGADADPTGAAHCRRPQRIPAVPDLPPQPSEEAPMWACRSGRKAAGPPAPADGRPMRRGRRRLPRLAGPAAEAASPETLSPDLPATAGDNPTAYHHPACGGTTTFTPDVAARISGDPFSFVPATYCASCRRYVGLRSVVWQGTRETLAAYSDPPSPTNAPRKDLLRVLGGPLIGVLLGAAIGALANPDARLLGILEGVVIGLPLGYFVTGIVFQIRWSMGQKKKAKAAAGGQSPGGGP